MSKITKEMTIMDVLIKDRESAAIFMKYGLHCLGCPGATMESIEDAGKVHGIDIGNLVDDLNKHFEGTK
ncbi:MAG: DUF1858 domain-containing protein [Clostridiales bacterium]|nr:DUF1858 domain-containing protein [Clostridiales bacterium]